VNSLINNKFFLSSSIPSAWLTFGFPIYTLPYTGHVSSPFNSVLLFFIIADSVLILSHKLPNNCTVHVFYVPKLQSTDTGLPLKSPHN
jgi:hypothetical protein